MKKTTTAQKAELTKNTMPANDQILTAAYQLAIANQYERGHAAQVTKLALQLFDRLIDLHGLGNKERRWLELAAILHDIGLGQGPERHHKVSRDLILASALPLKGKHKKMVALAARYHRGALPEKTHRYYADLKKKEKAIVDKLSAILRLADGLDRSHRDVVKSIVCQDRRKSVTLQLTVMGQALSERLYGRKKADLFEKVFGKKVEIK
jgi:exopolyphosphatase/guanosine-5'-triphosphate,3'-diphosphate pyrophosphatase